ncbi:unnamed protein product [Bubo scandiacus]
MRSGITRKWRRKSRALHSNSDVCGGRERERERERGGGGSETSAGPADLSSRKQQAFGLKKLRPSWLRKLLLLRKYVILELLSEKVVQGNIRAVAK